MREGDRLRRNGEWAAAENHYRRALQGDPGDLRAHAALQETYLATGRDLALRREYASFDPGFARGRIEATPSVRKEEFKAAPEPWRSLGAGAVALANGDRRHARTYFARATRMDPGSAWGWIALARVEMAEGRLGRAEAAYRAAQWIDPEHPSCSLGLSLIADRRGDLAAALELSVEAYRRAPAELQLGRRVRDLALRTGRARWTGEAGRLILRHAGPTSPEAHLDAAVLLGHAGESLAAERAFQRARELGMTEEEIRASRPPAPPPGLREFLPPFVRGVEARYRHYAATGEAESFADFLDWARNLYQRTTGLKLGPPGAVSNLAFVGKLLDARKESEDPLVQACAREGLLLVMGQRSGGPPEAIVARIARREERRAVRVRGADVEREVIWLVERHLSGYQEWAGEGDMAGLALVGLVLIDLDAVARWEGEVRRRRARLEPWREEILAGPALEADRTLAVEDPAGVADRLYMTSEISFAAEVLVHEEAHLVDALLHLPVGNHPLRNLGLVLRRGLSALEVLAYLERNAQLAAIAEGPTPRASLAVCCSAIGGVGPHARGYTEVVTGLVREIHARPAAFPTIDRSRLLVQQLHLLSEDEVRTLALSLQRRWGVRAG